MDTVRLTMRTYRVMVLGAREAVMRFRIIAATAADAEEIGMDLAAMSEGFNPKLATADLVDTRTADQLLARLVVN